MEATAEGLATSETSAPKKINRKLLRAIEHHAQLHGADDRLFHALSVACWSHRGERDGLIDILGPREAACLVARELLKEARRDARLGHNPGTPRCGVVQERLAQALLLGRLGAELQRLIDLDAQDGAL